ncbi:hypothetical protein PUN28_002498 [Cardiocondyla obscurior]|uniref:Uncharacterized protein n=1 Tax=Cardiocondyla obscurior TaxID=286306 RepID=A0AAW2GUM2_9HYME
MSLQSFNLSASLQYVDFNGRYLYQYFTSVNRKNASLAHVGLHLWINVILKLRFSIRKFNHSQAFYATEKISFKRETCSFHV